MVEMTETAAILHSATPRSLVLLDEIGRGTATFDGLSIAWAVAEYLHNSADHAAKTLFATHYHELTELAERLARRTIRSLQRSVKAKWCLHRLERGRASKSYGIEVARLAGLPPAVIAKRVTCWRDSSVTSWMCLQMDEPARLPVAEPLHKHSYSIS